MEFNPNKFKALVHYICYRADKDDLGATKLNKTLWYVDLWVYLINGSPMTGETYIKHSNSRRCMTRDLTHCQGDELGAINPWS
jgi:hypothetical protein